MPIVETTPWHTHWASEADTEAFARRWATCPALTHATLALYGDLGAGKTTLVRHLLRALGVRGRIKSPTYAVVEPHSTSDCALLPPGAVLRVWHFDFYRFNDPREWEDAGFRELFAAPGLKLVEWPQHAGRFLPVVDLRIDIETDDLPHPDIHTDTDSMTEPAATRHARLTALTDTGAALVRHLHP